MPDYPVIEAQVRSQKGSRAARRLRADGRIPAVIYGADTETASLSVDAARLHELVEQRARMVEVKIAGKSTPALVKEVQFDHLDSDIQHVDFEAISLTEVMEIEVPIETHGTPKGAKEGGMMEVVHMHVTVECKPTDIPREITVEVADLDINDTVTVADLDIPDGVRVLDDAELVVVAVHPPRVEHEVEEVAEEEIAEPEVIGAKREEEEGEEQEED